MTSSSSRRIRLEVRDACEEMLQTLKDRMSIVDLGEACAFPNEGLCWLSIKKTNEEAIQWPAWLVARGTEIWQGEQQDPDRDEWTRSVWCYGTGWTKMSRITELTPMIGEFAQKAISQKEQGGRLYQRALMEAKARLELEKDQKELSNFKDLVSQNLELCQHPVLLGRIYDCHRRHEPVLQCGSMLAIRWNENDWWQARVSRVGARVLQQDILTANTYGAAVEVIYDDDEGTEETIVQGSDIWKSDVRCLADNQSPRFDHTDVQFLLNTEFALDARMARTEDEEEEEQRTQGKPSKKAKSTPIYKDEALLGDLPEPAEDREDGPYRQPRDILPTEQEIEDEDQIKLLVQSRTSKPPRDQALNSSSAKRKRQREQVTEAQRADAAEKRRKMVEAAKSRWTVSKSGQALPPSTTATTSTVRPVPPVSVPAPSLPKQSPRRSKPKQSKQPSFLALLLSPPALPQRSDSLPSENGAKRTPKEDIKDNAVDVALVDRALEEAQEREARVLQSTMPKTSEKSNEKPPPGPETIQETEPSVPPSVPLNSVKSSKKPPPVEGLPPGWTAKWSERKGMYYYAHKTKRITRWTQPVASEDKAKKIKFSNNQRKSEANTSFDDEVPYFVDPPAPSVAALDAAKRTIAAYEASIRSYDSPHNSAHRTVPSRLPPATQNVFSNDRSIKPYPISSQQQQQQQQQAFLARGVRPFYNGTAPQNSADSLSSRPPMPTGRTTYFHPSTSSSGAAATVANSNNMPFLSHQQPHQQHHNHYTTPAIPPPQRFNGQQSSYQQGTSAHFPRPPHQPPPRVGSIAARSGVTIRHSNNAVMYNTNSQSRKGFFPDDI